MLLDLQLFFPSSRETFEVKTLNMGSQNSIICEHTGLFTHNCDSDTPVCCFDDQGNGNGCCKAGFICGNGNNASCSLDTMTLPPGQVYVPVEQPSYVVRMQWGEFSGIIVALLLCTISCFCINFFGTLLSRWIVERRALWREAAEEEKREREEKEAEIEVSPEEEAMFLKEIEPKRQARRQELKERKQKEDEETKATGPTEEDKPGDDEPTEQSIKIAIVESAADLDSNVDDTKTSADTSSLYENAKEEQLSVQHSPECKLSIAHSVNNAPESNQCYSDDDDVGENQPLLKAAASTESLRSSIQSSKSFCDHNKDDGRRFCTICLLNPIDCLLSCGHTSVCIDCAKRLYKCPGCEEPIKKRKKLYFPSS